MTEHNRQFDDIERQVSDRFRKDLRGLFEPAGSVPPQVDRAILEQARRRLAKPRRIILRIRWAGGIAAAAAVIAIGVILYHGPASSNQQSSINNHPSIIASSGDGAVLTIGSTNRGGHITPGAAIQTSAGEIKSLVLNGRHQVVMNAGTRLFIEPLVQMGQAGCLVNLALGEVCVHVEHDGNPFRVQTPHGRAVITGTTFDVKATEAGTTLVVAEGSVRFESEAGAVQVTAGQQSIIATTSAPPSTPAFCDAIVLTAWAGADRSTSQMAQAINSKGLLFDDLPLFPSPNTRTDLDSINYARWVEQNRNWFKEQFPEIFRLKDALAKEGIEADYPDLLLESAMVWRFAYPPAGRDRLLVAEDTAIVKAANRYGKDQRWLKDGGLLPIASPITDRQKQRMEAFSLWQSELVAAVVDSGKEVPTNILLSSLHACVYLRQTRSLIWLAVEADRYSVPNPTKSQLQALLQAEVTAADGGVSDVIRILTAERSILPCESDLYRQLVKKLYEVVTQMAQTEGRLADEMASSHP